MPKPAKKQTTAKKTSAQPNSKANAKKSLAPASSPDVAPVITPQAQRRPAFIWLCLMALAGAGLIVQLVLTKAPANLYFGPKPIPQAGVKLHVQLKQLLANIQAIKDDENSHELKVVDQAMVDHDVQLTRIDLGAHRWPDAKNDLAKLSREVSFWQSQLTQDSRNLQLSLSLNLVHPPDGQFIPILLYHNLPPDFEQQLIYLREHGYTTVTMDEVADSLSGRTVLPLKPVAITFDDGYSDQWKAYKLLKKYDMKAIYYIIISRADSGCGNRTSNCDPLYLSWDQVKQLDASGLIAIGDHTVDHPELSKLTRSQQQAEILGAKKILQSKLGHQIDHFCYPYGQYNDITLSLVRQDGFRTATTTTPGFFQSPGDPLTLSRDRNAFLLP